jgi:Family of unknown function (DUF7009)
MKRGEILQDHIVKLRIKGNSLRLRITRSELDKLASTGRIEETIHFAAGDRSCLTYALERSPSASAVSVRFAPPTIAVVLPSAAAESWQSSGETGIYAAIDLGAQGTLEVSIEKDFACLHGDDAENADSFPNPLTACT